ncbi:Transmembrane protein [Plasmodiophora brassicae]
MLAWWTFAIAVAAVVPGPAPVKSAISFPNTDVALLAKVSLLSPTMTYFLGPQACDPGPPTVSGPVVIYSAGDSCDPAALPPSVQGRIVFLNVPGGACSFEESYLRFSDLGISAIFCKLRIAAPA